MFSVRQITEPTVWETFVQQQPYTLFVQSAQYGEFYRSMGESSWILGLYNDDQLVGGSLVVSVHARRGNFLFVPYGPLLPEQSQKEALAVWHQAIKQLGIELHFDFLRVSPFMDDTSVTQRLFADLGFRPAPMHMLAETTWLLDIRPDEETLLKNMNKNHRNLIRRCLAAPVKLETVTDPAALRVFHTMHSETAKRHKFHRFSESYITKEFAAFAPHGHAKLLTGSLPNGSLDATAIIMSYGTMSCYRHGASYGLDKHVPASYGVQWEAIRQAKQHGQAWYNFWGIAPQNASKHHPFAGITHFKRGFGGVEKNLLHCQDFPLRHPRYYFNWCIETIRRVRRGF